MIQHPCELGRKQEDTSDLSVIQRTNHKQDTLKTLKLNPSINDQFLRLRILLSCYKPLDLRKKSKEIKLSFYTFIGERVKFYLGFTVTIELFSTLCFSPLISPLV